MLLRTNGLTCALCRDGEAHTDRRRGVAPLLNWLDNGMRFSGFCAADKVVGAGAAYLYVLLGVTEVYALVVSEQAKEILTRYGIVLYCEQTVPYIVNRTGNGVCPIEQAVTGAADPQEALERIRQRLATLQSEANAAAGQANGSAQQSFGQQNFAQQSFGQQNFAQQNFGQQNFGPQNFGPQAPYGAPPFGIYRGYAAPPMYPYPMPPYRPPAYSENYGLSILCLILAILSIVCCFVPFLYLATMIGGVVAFVLSSSLGQKEKAVQGYATGLNRAAFVCGIIGVSLSALNMLLGIILTL